MRSTERFRERYGRWALVAGASEGLGEAFADELAARGLDVVLVARRRDLLERVAAETERRHGVSTRVAAADLSAAEGIAEVLAKTAELEIGLLVCNAALAPIDQFLEVEIETHRQILALNCGAACELTHRFGREMVARRRGGIVLVSSMSSLQGTALVAHYAATKAYLRVLAEGLWEELRHEGVDVVSGCLGIVDTPAYRRSDPEPPGWLVPRPLSPDEAATRILDALGRGPVAVPGLRNRLAGSLTQTFLPKRLAVSLVSSATRDLYSKRRGSRRG